jgi:hypothetical protein
MLPSQRGTKFRGNISGAVNLTEIFPKYIFKALNYLFQSVSMRNKD